jgi:hypothetical protein
VTVEPIERYHRRPPRDKTLSLRKRCSSPWCTTGWERVAGRPYCSHCHERLVLKGEYWATKARMG